MVCNLLTLPNLIFEYEFMQNTNLNKFTTYVNDVSITDISIIPFRRKMANSLVIIQ
jgi:hypothetical protein